MEKEEFQQMFELYQTTGNLLEKILQDIGWFHFINVLETLARQQEHPELARQLENVLYNYVPEVR